MNHTDVTGAQGCALDCTREDVGNECRCAECVEREVDAVESLREGSAL
jgi:hypothetical protein